MVKQWFPDPRRSTESGETTGADQGQALRREDLFEFLAPDVRYGEDGCVYAGGHSPSVFR